MMMSEELTKVQIEGAMRIDTSEIQNAPDYVIVRINGGLRMAIGMAKPEDVLASGMREHLVAQGLLDAADGS